MQFQFQNTASQLTLVLMTSMVLAAVDSASAQTGSFKTFGTGCIGSASVSCPSNNANATTKRGWIQNGLSFAVLVPAQKRAMMVDGFEFFTSAYTVTQATIPTQLFMATAGGAPQTTAVAAGTMTIGSSLGWYKTTFLSPVLVPANTRVFIAYTGAASRMYLPMVPSASGTLATHYYRSSTTWLGPYTIAAWAWKLNCRQAPEIGCNGVPAIGKKHTLTLSGARPNAQAILAIGSKRLNPAFPWPGAPSCYLLTDSIILFWMRTNGTGAIGVTQPVPNDPTLVGAKFQQQFAVVDPVNAAGLVFSAGGEIEIGL